MSLQVLVNITKGWPSPFVVEKSLPAGSGVTLTQGLIATIATTGAWQLGVTSVDQIPFVIMVDHTDPSTNRGSALPTQYVQVGYGAIHGVGLNNPLEIETAVYDTGSSYAIGDVLSAPAGTIKKAASTEVVIGTVVAAPYSLGNHTYLTYIPTGKRVVS